MQSFRAKNMHITVNRCSKLHTTDIRNIHMRLIHHHTMNKQTGTGDET